MHGVDIAGWQKLLLIFLPMLLLGAGIMLRRFRPKHRP